jgi:hypothetical protein
MDHGIDATCHSCFFFIGGPLLANNKLDCREIQKKKKGRKRGEDKVNKYWCKRNGNHFRQ